ncbi:MAG: MotA/TolQ/ExbB proton channel family protein [Desulfamplus sp.]|nr:MotA/TolQ/ExbB proton channel family protein [Desulfamplus sp.]
MRDNKIDSKQNRDHWDNEEAIKDEQQRGIKRNSKIKKNIDLPNEPLWHHGYKNLVGLFICILLFFFGFVVDGNLAMYLNLSGFAIVLGGTFGSTILSYRLERLAILVKVLKASYTQRLRNPDLIVEILLELSVKRRLKGVMALQDDEEETTIIFLRQALGFIVDGYSPDQIRDSLHAEMYFFRMRRDEMGRILHTMADVAPAFGLVGSVVGLIGMLAGVGDSSVILATVPVALTSTLYGIVLANFVFIPFAANIRERTVKELMLQKIITEGAMAIAGDLHPRMLERKLKSFLTPSARKDSLISISKIRERFGIRSEVKNENTNQGDHNVTKNEEE